MPLRYVYNADSFDDLRSKDTNGLITGYRAFVKNSTESFIAEYDAASEASETTTTHPYVIKPTNFDGRWVEIIASKDYIDKKEESLDTRVSNNEANIASHTTSINTNTTDISDLNSDVGANEAILATRGDAFTRDTTGSGDLMAKGFAGIGGYIDLRSNIPGQTYSVLTATPQQLLDSGYLGNFWGLVEGQTAPATPITNESGYMHFSINWGNASGYYSYQKEFHSRHGEIYTQIASSDLSDWGPWRRVAMFDELGDVEIAKQELCGLPVTGGVKTISTTMPNLKLGSYIRHNNSVYAIDTSNATPTGTPVDGGGNWIKLTGTGTTIAASWESSVSTYSYDPIRNGWYDISDNQILGFAVHRNTAGNAHIVIPWGVNGNVHGSVISIATSTSSEVDCANADIVCDGTADEVEIKLGMQVAGKGGTVILSSGTYNVDTSTTVTSNLQGGANTVIKATSSMDGILEGTQRNMVKCIELDGNNLSNGGIVGRSIINFNVINCKAQNCTYGFQACQNITNCYAKNCTSSGFMTCSRISNCYANSNNSQGFRSCRMLTSCYAYNNENSNFLDCDQVSSCYAQDSDYGFYTCNQVSSCEAYNNNDNGFHDCDRVSSCYAISNGNDGFYICNQVSSCNAHGNEIDGFANCNGLTSNYALGNHEIGFNACRGMTANYSSNNTISNYGSVSTTSYADHGTAYPCADTPNGGFNG